MIDASHILSLLDYAVSELASGADGPFPEDVVQCRHQIRSRLWMIEAAVKRAESRVHTFDWQRMKRQNRELLSSGDGHTGEITRADSRETGGGR
jgi:hypothetical protein